MNIYRFALFLSIALIASIQLGIIIPLFPIIAHQQNISASLSGIVAAMTPLGGLVIALFSEKILQRWGFQRTILFGLIGNLILFIVLWTQPLSLANWLITRFFMGMMFSLTFMPAQTAIGLEAKFNRALYVNLIGVVFVVVLTIGPFFTNLMTYGAETVVAVLIGLQLTSLLMIGFIANSQPPALNPHQPYVSRIRLLPSIWVALLPALLFGCVELSLFSLFPQEALARGLSISQISTIIALFSFSALVAQLPISMLVDKFSARRVAMVLYPLVALILCVPLWSFTFWSLLGVSIGLGILIGHGYYFCVAYVNSMVQQEYLVKSNIIIEMMYNITTIVIPIMIGYYLNADDRSSIFVPLLVVSVIVGLLHYGKSFGSILGGNSNASRER